MNYVNVERALRQRFDGTPAARVLLATLAGHAGADGECQVPIRRLAEEVGCCPRTINKEMKFLEEKGLIARRPCFDAETRAQLPDITTVLGVAAPAGSDR